MKPAVEKTIAEGQCRVCPRSDIETAHLWPMSLGAPRYDVPDLCIPLCKTHHEAFDAHRLDLLPYLDLQEQVALVKAARGIKRAYDRVTDSGDAAIL